VRLELIPLADAVLPLIRSTSRDLWRYSAANEQGRRMHDGVELLHLAVDDPAALVAHGIRTPTPRQVYTVVHKALASAIRVIARADDSAGIIGDACRALIELHSRAAAAAEVPQSKLTDWVYDSVLQPSGSRCRPRSEWRSFARTRATSNIVEGAQRALRCRASWVRVRSASPKHLVSDGFWAQVRSQSSRPRGASSRRARRRLGSDVSGETMCR